MIERQLLQPLLEALAEAPAVCLLGPRQAGKTTLALEVAARLGGLYLDLESERDRARLADPEAYLERHLDRLVILDEVHRTPGLFPVLRGLIDRSRRAGRRAGLYLLLGSAGLDLLRQSGESLAGRVRLLELTPFSALEPTGRSLDALWLRGGFPESLLAKSDALSLRWRQDFIRTYLERDIPQLGPRIAAETLRRFWTMLAHRQGAPLNVAELARSLGVDAKTAARYLDLLVDLLLARRLAPWHANVGKRLTKSPRVYLRDSGILHSLLGIADLEALLAHPVVGASWEGLVIENLITAAPRGTEAYFYRTSGGAEIDLVLVFASGERWAVEVKRSTAPRPTRGFHSACEDLEPARRLVVYPGTERFPVAAGVDAIGLAELAGELHVLARRPDGRHRGESKARSPKVGGVP
ncbi:MAG TPA: ATP-binding protein [Thermoanaerobaculaceae bacterium]|nr:ATP-binding protein [Thermoanaerobaculaceae bacterium]HRS15319.1 ATP-binding protein [Thermoanaerobaculaceae bacterium]